MIWKRIFAIGIIVILLSIVVYNTAFSSDKSENEDSIFIVPEGMEVESGGTDVGDMAPNFQLENMKVRRYSFKTIEVKKFS
ncbi:hypothetical protein [Piscibacillus salipiscarius]|uniref:hypothetical protein n=1 Tax=Piscibacillus salipiscarius TaxID=299480 RepID=UPI0006D041F7|nr:hypothetical protein [Piscibacillus salipiscarius]